MWSCSNPLLYVCGIFNDGHSNWYEVIPHCSYFFIFFRAAPMAYGGSQARGRIGAIAAGLRHSHSNFRSKLHLQPTPQLTAMLDP